MSGKKSNAPKSAADIVADLEQQLAAAKAAVEAEAERKWKEAEERKRQEELKQIELAEIWREMEEKRWRALIEARAKAAPASRAKDGYCSCCITKDRMCQWGDAEKNPLLRLPILIHVLNTSPWIHGASLLWSSTPPLLHSSTPPLLHSSTPPLLHSSTPPLLHSSTPPLLHSSTPPPPDLLSLDLLSPDLWSCPTPPLTSCGSSFPLELPSYLALDFVWQSILHSILLGTRPSSLTCMSCPPEIVPAWFPQSSSSLLALY
ncbi:hypothetical protein BDR07DRAFT_1487417 [Suillus spraguei]|nr:hypothetical protein BDR07DRAFT_1487417 [Suillus spraguei]